MTGKAFRKGIAEGFLSPAALITPLQKRRRAADLYAAHLAAYRQRPLPDVSIGAAWDRVGWLLHEAMALEAEKINAERSAEKQEATSEGK